MMRLSSSSLILALLSLTINTNAFVSPLATSRPFVSSRLQVAAIQDSPVRESSRVRWEAAVFEDEEDEDVCPRGYYHNSVENTCAPLGPLGRASQVIETAGPFKNAYRAISNLFGIDTARISSLGVPFALAYAAISQINGALTLSAAWYMTCQRTGLSPFLPGQWKALLQSYGTLYALVQVLRPFRVAAAIGMSKLSREFLESTQEKLKCPRSVAIAFQYVLGYLAQFGLAAVGISLASLASGVPLFG